MSEDQLVEDGQYHFTKIDRLMRFESHGDCGSQPCYWSAKDAAGFTFYFGGTASDNAELNGREQEAVVWPANQQAIVEWGLKRVVGPSGNYWKVQYLDSSGRHALLPVRIEYNLHAAGGFYKSREILLHYITRQDRTPEPASHDQLLVEVEILSDGIPGICYDLGHTVSIASGRKVLTSIGVTSCLTNEVQQRYDFGYSDGLRSHGQVLSSSDISILDDNEDLVEFHSLLLGDINGDGLDDIVRTRGGKKPSNPGEVNPYGGQTTISIFTQLASADGFLERVHHISPDQLIETGPLANGMDPYWRPHLIKVNDDQTDDLMFVRLHPDEHLGDTILRIRVYPGEPATTSTFDAGGLATNHLGTQAFVAGPGYFPNVPWRRAFGDFNGDGHLDILLSHSYLHEWQIHYGGPDGLFSAGIRGTWPAPSQAPDCEIWNNGTLRHKPDTCVSPTYTGPMVADLNLDGRDDVIWSAGSFLGEDGPGASMIRSIWAFGEPSGGLSQVESAYKTVTNRDGFWEVASGDYDGDGYPDLSFTMTGITDPSTGKFYGRVFHDLLGPGRANSPGFITRSQDPTSFPDAEGSFCEQYRDYPVDLDGDGRSDLVSAYAGVHGTRIDRTRLEYSGWTGRQDIVSDPNYSWRDACVSFPKAGKLVGDFNGDGNGDFGLLILGVLKDENDVVFPVNRIQFRFGSSSTATGVGLPTDISGQDSPIKPAALKALVATGDVNGDGKQDIIMAPYELYRDENNNDEPPPLSEFHQGVTGLISYPEPVDTLESVRHSSGIEIDIAYSRALADASVVSEDANDCSVTLCGVPDTNSNYVVSHVVRRTHLRTFSNTAFEYSDRRARKWNDYLGSPKAGGFSWIREVDLLHGTSLERSYSQFEGYAGHVERVVQRDGAGLETERHDHEYVIGPLGAGRHRIKKWRTTSKFFSEGPLTRTENIEYYYDPHGFPSGHLTQRLDSDGSNSELEFQGVLYSHDTSSWNMGLVVAERSCRGGHLVDWTKRWYHSGSRELSQESRLLHEDGDHACPSYTVPLDSEYETELNAGRARWVVFRSNIQYQLGLPISEIDVRGGTNVSGYDTTFGTHLAVSTNSLSQSEFYTYDVHGRRTGTRDVAGNWTTESHDELGRIEWERLPISNAPSTGTSVFEFLDMNQPQMQRVHTRTLASATEVVDDDIYFDGLGLKTRTSRAYFDGRTVERYFNVGLWSDPAVFEGVGRVEISSEPHFCNAGSCEPAVENILRYDEMGRPLQSLTRDNSGTLHPLVTYGYFPNKRTRVDAKLNKHTDTYDYLGRLVKIQDPANLETHFKYYPSGYLKSIQRPDGGLISYEYDSWGRITKYGQPETGSDTYTWTDDSLVQTKTNEIGDTVTYVHDPLGRLLNIFAPAVNYGFVYDDLSVQNGTGRLSWVTDNGTITRKILSYDTLGNATQVENYSAAFQQGLRHSYSFDWGGRLETKTFPNQALQSYEYRDHGGPLHKVFVDGGLVHTQVSHDASGRALDIETGADISVNRTYAYDGLMLSQTAFANQVGDYLQYSLYVWDSVRNLVDLADQRPSRELAGIQTDLTRNYTYDSLNRLTQSVGVSGTKTYSYDAIGDLVQKAHLIFTEHTNGSTHDSVRFLDGSDSAGLALTSGYDAAGQSTFFQDHQTAVEHRYLRDGLGRITMIEEGGQARLEARYDSDNERRYKRSWHADGSWTDTYYLEDDFEVRIWSGDSGHVQETLKVFAGPELVMQQSDSKMPQGPDEGDVYGSYGPFAGSTELGPPPGTWYLLSDHIGSTSIMTDDEGQVASFYHYTPFGEIDRLHSVGFDAALRGFGLMTRDSETELSVFPHRHYDPRLGRFIAPDPTLPFDGYDPQGLNRYAYVLNNPLRYVDPSGELPIILPVVLTAAIEAAVLKATLVLVAGTAATLLAAALAHLPGGARVGSFDDSLSLRAESAQADRAAANEARMTKKDSDTATPKADSEAPTKGKATKSKTRSEGKRNIEINHSTKKSAKEAAKHATGGKVRPTPKKSDTKKRKEWKEQQKYKKPESHPKSKHPESHFHDSNKTKAKVNRHHKFPKR